jgi:hypothetical protein
MKGFVVICTLFERSEWNLLVVRNSSPSVRMLPLLSYSMKLINERLFFVKYNPNFTRSSNLSVSFVQKHLLLEQVQNNKNVALLEI